MKLKHNKKRNVAFIYEVLIKELSKASMKNLEERKVKILNILKNYFYKGSSLKEELEIHHSFSDLTEADETVIQKIISEARLQASKLDFETSYLNKTKIINLINKELGQESWETFVNDYKKMATVNQVVFQSPDPKKQVFLEQKLIKILKQVEVDKKPFPTVNKLALKTFLERFNDQYKGTLNEQQKKLLSKYITSHKDDGLELKMFVYDEIDRLKECLSKKIDDKAAPKLSLVIEKINGYSHKRIDKNMITEIIKIQSLTEELNNGTDA